MCQWMVQYCTHSVLLKIHVSRTTQSDMLAQRNAVRIKYITVMSNVVWRLESPTDRLFVQKLVQLMAQERPKLHITGLLRRQSTGMLFHVMTSPCVLFQWTKQNVVRDITQKRNWSRLASRSITDRKAALHSQITKTLVSTPIRHGVDAKEYDQCLIDVGYLLSGVGIGICFNWCYTDS